MAKKKSGLNGLSTASLQRELERRQSQFSQLKKLRDQLIEQVLDIDEELKALSGAASAGGAKVAAGSKPGRKAGSPRGPRPKNALGLPESLAAMLKGKIMTVSEAADAVKKAGYKTNAVNFRVMVNQAFIKHKKLFKKVKHGHYTTV
ncbi:MAG: hypothetical protein NTV94_19350 [Planctomycetota bacterium]|nr:hypothetical protein [Planctomycetota bacterium]